MYEAPRSTFKLTKGLEAEVRLSSTQSTAFSVGKLYKVMNSIKSQVDDMSHIPLSMHVHEGMLEARVSVKPALKGLGSRCRTNSKQDHNSRK